MNFTDKPFERMMRQRPGTDSGHPCKPVSYTHLDVYKRQVVKGKDVTKESINAAMKAATSESFGYNEDPIVSSDVIGMRYGCLLYTSL